MTLQPFLEGGETGGCTGEPKFRNIRHSCDPGLLSTAWMLECGVWLVLPASRLRSNSPEPAMGLWAAEPATPSRTAPRHLGSWSRS